MRKQDWRCTCVINAQEGQQDGERRGPGVECFGVNPGATTYSCKWYRVSSPLCTLASSSIKGSLQLDVFKSAKQ